MNARLKKLKDGTGAMHRNEVVWFDVLSGDKTTRAEFGEIYWPFALVWNCTSASDHNYDVVHLPSGYWVVSGTGIPRRRAIWLVRKLRKIGDWSFTKPSGPRWEAMKASEAGTLYRTIKAEQAEALRRGDEHEKPSQAGQPGKSKTKRRRGSHAPTAERMTR